MFVGIYVNDDVVEMLRCCGQNLVHYVPVSDRISQYIMYHTSNRVGSRSVFVSNNQTTTLLLVDCFLLVAEIETCCGALVAAVL